MNETDQEVQQAVNAKILSSLDSIHSQNRQIAQKIDDLEQSVTKKATTAGAISGAIAGGIISVGVEFIKLKWGG